MSARAKLSEQLAIVATRDPVSQGIATVVTDWIDMTKFRKAMFVLMTGAMTASSTVDAKLRRATDGSGTGAADLATNKAITQLTQAGTDDNKQVVIEVDSSEILQGAYTHVALSVTVAAAASLLAVLGIAALPRYQPASDNDLASVDEIVP